MTTETEQKILDLGNHGILALTLNWYGKAPLPAHQSGFAVWHERVGPAQHDCMALCTREIPEYLFQMSAGDYAAKFKPIEKSQILSRLYLEGAAEFLKNINRDRDSVTGRFLVVPRDAVVLNDGVVLLYFESEYELSYLRIVDIPAQKILLEQSVTEITALHGLNSPNKLHGYPFTISLALTSGKNIWIMTNHQAIAIFEFESSSIHYRGKIPFSYLNKAALSMSKIFRYSSETNEIEIFSKDLTEPPHLYHSQHADGKSFDILSPIGQDICAILHTNCHIELLNGDGAFVDLIQPFDNPDYIGFAIAQFTQSGRYLLVREEKNRQFKVIDLLEMKIAALDLENAKTFEIYTASASEISYHVSYYVIDDYFVIAGKNKIYVCPFKDWNWQPVRRPETDVDVVQILNKNSELKQLMATWFKPSFSLNNNKTRHQFKSQCYGTPHVGADFVWPTNEEEDLLFLAQIDLEEIGSLLASELNPYPNHGALLFFVAYNEDGPVIDDQFNPAATVVIWVRQMANEPLSMDENTAAYFAQPMYLERDSSEYPLFDAVICQSANLSHENAWDYRMWQEKIFPEGHERISRLGGYSAIIQQNCLEMYARNVCITRFPDHVSNSEATPEHWRLLLQLDSDENIMWGTDSGIIYFMIHDADLAQRDFSRVIAITEGH